MASNNERMTVTEAAEIVGVAAKTIIRWEKAGKIRRGRRDWRGWRVYTHSDLKELIRFHETLR